MVQHSIIHSPNFKYWESYRVSGQWYFTDWRHFYKNFQQGIFYLAKILLGKCVIGIMAIAIGIVVITAVIETVLIVKASAKKPQENATLIVLGCKVYGEHASRSLRERLDAALIYLEENPNSQCIVSGGMGEGEKISEAECMYRYLTKKGINSSRIIKEDKSTSTRGKSAIF